jgi:sugar phosphate isomerase/epimerase
LAAGVNIAESVMPLGRLWRHLYVVDGFRDFASRRFVATQLGRGSLDVDELAAVMDGIGYDGWWMVEPTDGAATAESLSLAANFVRNL